MPNKNKDNDLISEAYLDSKSQPFNPADPYRLKTLTPGALKYLNSWFGDYSEGIEGAMSDCYMTQTPDKKFDVASMEGFMENLDAMEHEPSPQVRIELLKWAQSLKIPRSHLNRL